MVAQVGHSIIPLPCLLHFFSALKIAGPRTVLRLCRGAAMKQCALQSPFRPGCGVEDVDGGSDARTVWRRPRFDVVPRHFEWLYIDVVACFDPVGS